MRIGVAIPCYKYHISILKRCLDSIEAQTRKPDEVVVSCSSCTDTDIPSYSYSFPLRIITRPTRHNAAENRNYAAGHLTTDIISFFDCDDVMHPQRIELVLGCFPCDIVLHAFVQKVEHTKLYPSITRIRNILRQGYYCAVVGDDYSILPRHAHVSVRRRVLDRVRYTETVEWERREDSYFCWQVLAIPEYKNVFIMDPLSSYYETGQTFPVESPT